MHRGYVKFWRKTADNDLWLSEPFSRGQAWCDLLILANHKPGVFYCRGVRVEIKRGQVGVSEVALAERWKWSRGKVRRFLDERAAVQQIVQQKGNVTSVITICNYDLYQGGDTADSTASDTASSTADGQQTDTNNNVKNEKNTPLTPDGGDRRTRIRGSSKRMSAADKQRCRVDQNTPLMIRIGAWFGRGPETRWTVYEAEALAQVERSLTEAEISGMEAYYTAETVGDIDARRRNVATLLNNWPGELDRARAYYRETKNGKQHSNRPAEPVIMGSG